MRWCVAVLGLVALLTGPAPTAAQATDALGIVRNGGYAHLYYEWSGSEWRHARWTSQGYGPSDAEPWVGVTVTFADTLGVLHTGELGSASPGNSDEVIYPLPAAHEYHNDESWFRLAMGYFTTLQGGHASFAQVESGVVSEPWNRFIRELEESPDSVPMQVRASVWRARLADRTLTYFQVSRQADVERGCPGVEYYSGIILAGTAEPVVATRDSGDCEGKGATSREPVGLVERSNGVFVLVSTYGWEWDSAELWEVGAEGLELVGFPN